MYGWGVGIDLAGYRKYFPDITQDMAYSRCFIECAERVIRDSISLGHRYLKFTFDSRQGSGTTALLYAYIASQPEWKDSILLADEISFGNRQDPRIQAADLLARETMKELDRVVGGTARPQRKSLGALAGAGGRFQFRYLMREFFASMTEQMAEMGKIAGFSKGDYVRWLQQTGAQHNLSSMHRFLLWFDAQDKRNKDDKARQHGNARILTEPRANSLVFRILRSSPRWVQ